MSADAGLPTRELQQPDPAAQPRIRPRLGIQLALNALVAVPFALLFAYDVWEAFGNLVGIVSYANSLRVGVVGWGWIVLIGSAALPALLWMLALVLGWRRPVPQKLVLQLLALTVSAATYLSIITLFNDTNLLQLS